MTKKDCGGEITGPWALGPHQEAESQGDVWRWENLWLI